MMASSAPSPRRNSLSTANVCTGDNVEQVFDVVSREFYALGYYDSSGGVSSNGGKPDLVALLNGAMAMLRQVRRSEMHREELQQRLNRANSDMQHLQKVRDYLKEQLASKEKEVAEAQEKERQSSQQSAELQLELKSKKAQVAQLVCSQQHREIQFQHELRKTSSENQRMKEHLHRSMANKKAEAALGMEILNPGGRGTLSGPCKRLQWKTEASLAKVEQQVDLDVIRMLERRQQEFVEENHSLLGLLTTATHHMHIWTRRMSDLLKEEEQSTCENGAVSVDSMPSQLVKGKVTRVIRKCDETCERAAEYAANRLASLESELEKYEHKEHEWKEIMAKYLDNPLGQGPCGDDNANVAFLHDAYILEEKTQFEQEKQELEREKLRLAEERRTYTDSFSQLYVEKEAFRQQKMKFFLSQFCQTPAGRSNDNPWYTPPCRTPGVVRITSENNTPATSPTAKSRTRGHWSAPPSTARSRLKFSPTDDTD